MSSTRTARKPAGPRSTTSVTDLVMDADEAADKWEALAAVEQDPARKALLTKAVNYARARSAAGE